MASQPSSSGDQYVVVSAAGTTVSADRGINLSRVLISGTFVGSVEFYDSATAAGTAAGNRIFSVGLPGADLSRSIEIDATTRSGLVVVATGTPALTYTKG